MEEKIFFDEKEEISIDRPELYRVYLLNDDYTTMDFVVYVLMTIFDKSKVEATAIMLHVHKHGKGLAGIYPKEIAETKVYQVESLARAKGFPLKCSIERNDQ
ncbi:MULTISPECIES: ATP-dependent Clp protease adapter ClpS [Thermodesulfovibrio]|jgi:ATP-dependent Clp protease adaptor protein ClpS|uniref:ATP-dependent Clp protease adapter protein ClpS n=2 Tax=Thermodesulfovibrio yellowstonii TaxID=28262 RepID=B5YGC3_THEYD|nr:MULTISPECIES: ATP-dependent Clp protease adapter ClpS [Thermodesulfovibrio]ACI20418.1 ATP-dependent Clp protease adaptor protein ClpS [Thermodesulfovibrio yellowstonii DSM 11347]MDI6865157.1 ATP-dependent Clp protease adapter ClpS [Thermodesulfovibrio yellowstonii]GLI53086.1 ATP-dependent Clp protease adapter protein ClpS [Thermodesulfovibrio islandicus]